MSNVDRYTYKYIHVSITDSLFVLMIFYDILKGTHVVFVATLAN